jgi:hypothetical protein
MTDTLFSNIARVGRFINLEDFLHQIFKLAPVASAGV